VIYKHTNPVRNHLLGLLVQFIAAAWLYAATVNQPPATLANLDCTAPAAAEGVP
jgi:hypothetical protein